jgi:hypothetical protein
MWFSTFKFVPNINPTGNILFTVGWFFVNLYTTCYLFYRKSPVNLLITQWYNFFVPSTSLEYIPNAENCEFIIYTFDKVHKKISTQGHPVMSEKHVVLKDPPFLSTEILVTSSDGKSVTNYPVEFRTDNYDYYVVGNVFHPRFITYYMKKHHYVNLCGCDYSIHAIDRDTFDTKIFLRCDTPIKITK